MTWADLNTVWVAASALDYKKYARPIFLAQMTRAIKKDTKRSKNERNRMITELYGNA